MPVKFDVPEVARSMTDPVSATPVLSIVVSLARSAANMAMTSAAVATPVVSIVEMRLLRFPDVL